MEIVQYHVDGPIGVIAMDRPDKRNALSAEMVGGISAAIDTARRDERVKVIVLKGNGPAFCAGADLAYLQQISQNTPMENLADSTSLMEMMQSIVECPKPVIAMVHGPAIAGGCGLATVCDVVVAAEEGALFGYSEVKIGFIPAIVMVYLLRKVGDTQTRRLVLTARNISASEAMRIGLIAEVVPDAVLEERTMELARQMAGNSSSSMALSKEMLANLPGMDMRSGLRYAASMNALARQTEDCKAGIARFLTPKK